MGVQVMIYDDENVLAAIERLCPGAAYELKEDGDIVWRDSRPLPTEDKIKNAINSNSLGDIAQQKRTELDATRDAAINAGFTHTFSDKEDIVQTRKRDRENLTGLAVSAQRHPEETFYFRAQSNATYQLTAAEMLALADAAQAHVSQQYAKSWQLKAQLDAALEAEDRAAINALKW